MALTETSARLTVLTGPSGVGKGTLVTRLRERHPSLWLSVSATTRAPRDGERDGEHYFFHTRDRFDALVAEGGLLEWAEFAGNCYGTPVSPLRLNWLRARRCFWKSSWRAPDKCVVHSLRHFKFSWHLSFDALEQRIRGRGTDSEEAIQKRLARARQELEAQAEFDAVVVNDDLELALAELERLMGLSGTSPA